MGKRYGIFVEGKIEFVSLAKYAAAIMREVDEMQVHGIEAGREEAEQRAKEKLAEENKIRLLKGLKLREYAPKEYARPIPSPMVGEGAIKYYFQQFKDAAPDHDPVLETLEEIERDVLGWEREENPIRGLEEDMAARGCSPAAIQSFVGAARRYMRFTDWEPEFTAKEATRFLASLNGFKAATRYYYKAMLKTWFLALKLEWPLEGRRYHYTSEEETIAPSYGIKDLQTLIRLAKGRGSPEAQYYLALSTVFGFRSIELGGITATNFNWNGSTGLLVVQTAKHGRRRQHQIPEEIVPYLKLYSYEAVKMPAWKIRECLREWCKEIGFKQPKGFGFHAIRHGLNTALIERGLDSVMVERWMGWKSGRRGAPVMAAVYYSPEKLDEKVWAKHPFAKEWV